MVPPNPITTPIAIAAAGKPGIGGGSGGKATSMDSVLLHGLDAPSS
jgi:hypothetical protein